MALPLETSQIKDEWARRAIERIGLQFPFDEAAVPNLAAAFTTYKTIAWGGAVLGGGVAGVGTYVLWVGSPVTVTGLINANNGSAAAAIAIDPAEWTANARTTKLRLRVKLVTNAVAPGITFVAGFYPITGYGGAAGQQPFIATVGAVTAGSICTFTTPALSTNTNVAAEFTAPAAGDYLVAFTSSGAMAANALAQFVFQLQMRQT